MALITLFTAPKPFTDPHIDMIQRNAIRSWIALGDDVEVLLLGEEAGMKEAVRDLGVKWIPELDRNSEGTPLISSMFKQARQHGNGELLCIINADILLLPDLLEAARKIKEQSKHFLLMGQRWDLNITRPLAFGKKWEEELRQNVRQDGRLHKAKGSDYFIFRRSEFEDFPPFAIGRAGWDNWTIYSARKRGWQVIDATASATVVHQQHDYHHLPGGKIHYTLPESDENLRLAGGKRHIFTLADANFRLDGHGHIGKIPFSFGKLKRDIEVFPILQWDNTGLNNFMFYLMNPKKLIRHKLPKMAKALGIKGKADEVDKNE